MENSHHLPISHSSLNRETVMALITIFLHLPTRELTWTNIRTVRPSETARAPQSAGRSRFPGPLAGDVRARPFRYGA